MLEIAYKKNQVTAVRCFRRESPQTLQRRLFQRLGRLLHPELIALEQAA